MHKTKGSKVAPKGALQRGGKRVSTPLELRLKAVKLYLEEGIPPKLIYQELHIQKNMLFTWVKNYRERGEAGLQPRYGGGGAPRPSNGRLQQKIAEVKRQQPTFGVKRISQWMRRMLFLKASPETVRKTLHQQGLMPKSRKRPQRNPPSPRFFERSTPNQMWQSDIFTFRLGGKNAYLIGFVDDYSRYVVGLGLYRSQTGENLLEVYRTAVSEYGVPKELLTDNGRQYANWRGKTRFQMELAKDRVHHILARPHHPMTKGKVERFWKTIWEEFLVRGQFGSFEEARDRVKYWVQYFNHKRPHQGLDGLCPADRFFEIQQELRKVIEKGIKENAQALALNRAPKEPFYMVGRMGGQSVVLQVEKGQFQMHVDGKESDRGANYIIGGKPNDGRNEEATGAGSAQRAGEGGGGAGLVDGAETAVGDLPGDADHEHAVEPMAGAGDGRYTYGAGAADEVGAGAEASAAGEGGTAAGPQNGLRTAIQACQAADVIADQGVGQDAGDGGGEPLAIRRSDESEGKSGGAGGAGATQGGGDRPGAERAADSDGGGEAAGRVAEDLLPVGTSGSGGNGQCAPGQGGGQAVEAPRPAEGGDAGASGGPGGAAANPGAGGPDPGRSG